MSCAIQYLPGFIAGDAADRLLRWCLSPACAWRQERFSLFGKVHSVPRRVSWFGAAGLNYRYTGLDHVADGWPDELMWLRARVGAAARREFNFVLLNRYDSGAHHMGWHRDDEAGLNCCVASVSLGERRRFRYRVADEPSRHVDLEHGSLLLFDGRLTHMLARTRKAVDCRVNLTFRQLAQSAGAANAVD